MVVIGTAPAPEETVNLRGASKIAKVGVSTIRYWILSGWLPAERAGAGWQIKVSDLIAADQMARASSRSGKRGRRGRLSPAPEAVAGTPVTEPIGTEH